MTQRRASVVVARGYEPDSGHAVDADEVARRSAAAVLARRSAIGRLGASCCKGAYGPNSISAS